MPHGNLSVCGFINLSSGDFTIANIFDIDMLAIVKSPLHGPVPCHINHSPRSYYLTFQSISLRLSFKAGAHQSREKESVIARGPAGGGRREGGGRGGRREEGGWGARQEGQIPQSGLRLTVLLQPHPGLSSHTPVSRSLQAPRCALKHNWWYFMQFGP
jgi:hypothetical protein